VLVNNVGDLYIGEITETPVEDWDRLMATNLRSMFLCCKHVLPTMVEQRSGSIVNLASISSFIGQEAAEGGPSFFAYSVTKAGAASLRRRSPPVTRRTGSASTPSRRELPARSR
jgi:meso-butanediol dehydrogenase/(S,S)-butanediol dehydrogenase/diacetyl reductase